MMTTPYSQLYPLTVEGEADGTDWYAMGQQYAAKRKRSLLEQLAGNQGQAGPTASADYMNTMPWETFTPQTTAMGTGGSMVPSAGSGGGGMLSMIMGLMGGA